jgi:hypothetical protein
MLNFIFSNLERAWECLRRNKEDNEDQELGSKLYRQDEEG